MVLDEHPSVRIQGSSKAVKKRQSLLDENQHIYMRGLGWLMYVLSMDLRRDNRPTSAYPLDFRTEELITVSRSQFDPSHIMHSSHQR